MSDKYYVVQEASGMRMRRCGGGDTAPESFDGAVHDSFEGARQSAVGRLDALIASYRDLRERVAVAPTFGGYLTAPLPTTDDSRADATPPKSGGDDQEPSGVAPTGRAFYKTVYEILVLSDEPPEFDGDLHSIAYDIDEGPCVGDIVLVSTERVTREEVERLLLGVGSDPGFFLDEDEEEAPPRDLGAHAPDSPPSAARRQRD